MPDKNNLTQTLRSVFSAFIGVQSEENRQRDFKQGKVSHFIIAGVIFVVLFIAALVTIVSLVVPG